MNATGKQPVPGRLSALAGLVLGGAASLSANVAHAVYVLPNVSVVTLGSALFWPSAALLGFEAVVRPPWPTKGLGSVPWWILRLGVVGVAVVAVVSSYEHMSGLLRHFHDNPFTVRYGPAAVDGLMVTCAAALLVIERYGPTRSTSPRSDRSTPIALTAHPAQSTAWSAPTRSIDPDPIASIESTLRSIEGVRSVPAATRSIAPRSTATIPDPIDPDRPLFDSIGPDSAPDRPAPDRPRSTTPPRSGSTPADRPDPAWVARSTLAPGGGAGHSLEELTADLDAALGSDDRVPSAEAIRRHYGIGAPRNRELRDAVTNVRRQRATGGVEGEIQ